MSTQAQLWHTALNSAIVLALLIIAFVLVAYIWARFSRLPSRKEGELQIIDQLPLGYGRWLYVISWRGRRLLIGATNYSITNLGEG